MPANKPTTYALWNPSQSNVTQPPTTLRARGYQTGESPTAQHINWVFWLQDQWTQYFDQSLTSAVMTTTLDSSMRLMGGGTLSYVVSTGVFTWSAPLFLSIPSVPDADNQIAAGNVVVSAGQVLYVQANVPFTSAGDLTSGTATVTNVAYTAGIAAGQAVTGAGIAANTTVVSVSGTTVTLSANATASGQQTPLTYAGTSALTVQAASVAALVPSANTVILGRATATALYVGVNSGQMILRDGEQRRLLEAGYHDVRYPAAGASLTARQAVYMATAADGRTLGAAYPADASQANGALRSTCIGFATTTTATGNVVSIVTGGVLGGFTGLLAGATYYLDSGVVGGITATKPSGGSYVVPVGYAADATSLYVRVGSASGAPVLDPSYNSVIVQPVSGDTNTVQLAVRDNAGINKLVVDAGGNVTAPSTFSIATLTASGTATAASLVSAAGIKTTLAPAYLNMSISANSTPGANGISPISMNEATLSQIFNAKSPFRGSIVGMQVTYRFNTSQGTSPALSFVITVSGANNNQWANTFNANNTAGAIDYAFVASQAKGTQAFAVGDNIQATFSSGTQFSAATAFYARLTIWVETLS